MSHRDFIHFTRVAKVNHGGARGLTVGHVREFLAEVDRVGIGDATRVDVEDRLAPEGASRNGYIAAWQTESIGDVDAD